jgi:accessory gene regulator B
MMKKFFLLTAGFIGTKVGLSFEDQEVVAYGMEVIFSVFLSLILALILGLRWGIVPEILVVALVWMIIRSFAGGAHCSTLWRCALSSTLVMVSLGGAARIFSTFFNQKLVILTILFCGLVVLIITFIWAPADNPVKRILSESRRRNFRSKALVVEISVIVFLLSACFLTGNTYSSLLFAAGLAMGMEGLTVSPAGYRIMTYIDKSLGFLEKAIWKGGEKG